MLNLLDGAGRIAGSGKLVDEGADLVVIQIGQGLVQHVHLVGHKFAARVGVELGRLQLVDNVRQKALRLPKGRLLINGHHQGDVVAAHAGLAHLGPAGGVLLIERIDEGLVELAIAGHVQLSRRAAV